MRWMFWRCPKWRYVPGELAVPTRLYCELKRGHEGKHLAGYGFSMMMWGGYDERTVPGPE